MHELAPMWARQSGGRTRRRPLDETESTGSGGQQQTRHGGSSNAAASTDRTAAPLSPGTSPQAPGPRGRLPDRQWPAAPRRSPPLRRRQLLRNHLRNRPPQARRVAQNTLNLVPLLAHTRTPTPPRTVGRRDLQLDQMVENLGNAAA